MIDLGIRTLRLPWPSSVVFPNTIRKLHWSKRSTVTKKAKEAAMWECKAQGVGPMQATSVRATIVFTPPRRPGRRPDRDGMIGAMKAAQDGIAEVIGIDDGRWITSYAFGEPEGDGHVEITLEALP